jgi:dephospho-CoA kinase
MKEAKIIILTGKARCGKSTCAEIIKNNLDNTVEIQTGYYIKDYVKRITGWDGLEETKPRDELNRIGTDIIRNQIDEYLFIKRTIEDLKVFSFFYKYIVISDARFDYEIEMIKENFKDTIVINVFRDNFVSELTEKQLKHRTENSINYDNCDYKIENSGTIDELKEKIFKILEEVK